MIEALILAVVFLAGYGFGLWIQGRHSRWLRGQLEDMRSENMALQREALVRKADEPLRIGDL